MSLKPKIPVVIVTGFLGAGKTTFINELLKQNKGVKIGLIENEFGDVSIDARLMTDYQPESIVELNNDCIWKPVNKVEIEKEIKQFLLQEDEPE